METYKVYITQNLLYPEKAYVGMTNGHYPKYMGSDDTLNKDIKLLGIENFSKTVLFESNNHIETHYWEGFYIRTLKTHISQGGYNTTWHGGRYIVNKIGPNKGKTFSEETKKKIGKSKKGNKHMLGHKHTEESKKKMSDNGGHGQTEETRNKISETMKNKSYENVTCPYCGKIGCVLPMNRWHFDNCKQKL